MTTRQRRGRPASERRLYTNPRWRRLRALQLSEHPLCAYCEQAGRLTPADTVDHIIPHRGDETLMWDQANLESVCSSCHTHLSSVKDHTGIIPGCDLQGFPLDRNHDWRPKEQA